MQPATIAGQIDVSRQLIERGVQVDVMLARELGAAYGERLDLQIINGSGAAGQLLGLLNVTGVTATTYDDVSPTGAELLAKLWKCSSDVATAIGYGPTELIVLHPRRRAWLRAQALTAASPYAPVPTCRARPSKPAPRRPTSAPA